MVNTLPFPGLHHSGRHGQDPNGTVREDFYLNLAIVMMMLIGVSSAMAMTFPVTASDHAVATAADCSILLFITKDGKLHVGSPGSNPVPLDAIEGKVREAMRPLKPPVSLAVLRPALLQVGIEDDVLQQVSRIDGIATFVSQVEYKSNN